MKAQRLRFRFRVTPEAAALGSRDIGNAWVDAVAAAGLVVARSGKRSTAQVSVAAPLSQGATSDWELIDVHLEEPADPTGALCRIAKNLPPASKRSAFARSARASRPYRFHSVGPSTRSPSLRK